LVDVAVLNTKPIPALLQERYAEEHALPVENDVDVLESMGIRILHRELAADGAKVRHDPAAIAAVAVELATESRRRLAKAMTA
jgi:hypothetical protein